MTATINDWAYLGPWRVASALPFPMQHCARGLDGEEGLGFIVAHSWAKSPHSHITLAPQFICDFYVIFKY